MNDAFPLKHLHFLSRNFLPVRRIKKKDLVSTLFEQMREKSIVRRSKVHFLSIPVFDETLINIFVAIYSRCRFKERKKENGFRSTKQKFPRTQKFFKNNQRFLKTYSSLGFRHIIMKYLFSEQYEEPISWCVSTKILIC